MPTSQLSKSVREPCRKEVDVLVRFGVVQERAGKEVRVIPSPTEVSTHIPFSLY